MVSALTGRGFAVAIEVAPQSTLGYSQLAAAGTLGVTLYQETYDPELYSNYHPKGTKAWYDWRLEGPERAAEAGIRRIGLGILLGLGDPRGTGRSDCPWPLLCSSGFPTSSSRSACPGIHDAPAASRRLIAWTTNVHPALLRSSPGDSPRPTSCSRPVSRRHLRDRLARTCITQMQRGSSTSPGGYQEHEGDGASREQFPVVDQRSPEEVVRHLIEDGFRVVWNLTELQAR